RGHDHYDPRRGPAGDFAPLDFHEPRRAAGRSAQARRARELRVGRTGGARGRFEKNDRRRRARDRLPPRGAETRRRVCRDAQKSMTHFTFIRLWVLLIPIAIVVAVVYAI